MTYQKVPLVSVFMITYNHEKYIAQAIESVLMQRTTFKFEIVIGEDYSCDSTRKIVESYEKRYPDIIIAIYQDTNIGMIRNAYEFTFQKCRGKYIAICEGDDYWTDPFKLQKQVDFLEGNGKYAAIGHQTEIIYENEPGRSELFYKSLKDTLTRKDIIFSFHIHANSIVYRKNALSKYDLKKVRYLYDHPLFILIVYSGKIKVLPETMAVYRRHHSGAAGTSTPEKAYPEQIAWINEIREILRRNFLLSYHFLSSRVHVYYALNHPEIFRGGILKRNFYFLKYAALTLLLYPRNMKSIVRLIPKLSGSTKSI